MRASAASCRATVAAAAAYSTPAHLAEFSLGISTAPLERAKATGEQNKIRTYVVPEQLRKPNIEKGSVVEETC